MPYVERADVKRSHAAMFDPKAGPPAFTDEDLTSLPHATLCVHGRDDIIVPVESSTYLAKTMPNASLHIIPKCGHWTQIEAHDTFIFLLESLIAGKFRSPAQPTRSTHLLGVETVFRRRAHWYSGPFDNQPGVR